MRIDLTKPNSGRMLDYWLGGEHHFEIDRIASLQLVDLMPDIDWKEAYLIHRRFVGRTARYMWEQGLDKFLDFGSGLPTMGNIHEVVPEAKVLYTDNDEVSIAYSQEILGNNPNVRYEYCDMLAPETILESAILEDFFGSDRRIAISATAMPHFFDDEEMRRFFQTLYEWADEGSYLATSNASRILEQVPSILESFAKLGFRQYIRDPNEILSLIGNWKPTEHGVVHVGTWGREDDPEPGDAGLSWGLMLHK